MSSDPTKQRLFKWCLDNLLRESGYINVYTAPFAGGPYFYRRSDRTFWELHEQRIMDLEPSKEDSGTNSKSQRHQQQQQNQQQQAVVLCFRKINRAHSCESLQESYNTSLGQYESNQKYGYGNWYSDDVSSRVWVPATRNDPRRFKYDAVAQTKAPFTMSISLKPEILQSCLDKHHQLVRAEKKNMKKKRETRIKQLVSELGLCELPQLPVELSRYSQKCKRRYYVFKQPGVNQPLSMMAGKYTAIWCVNYLDHTYSGPITFWKPASYDELCDVCRVNDMPIPPVRYLNLQNSILYTEG